MNECIFLFSGVAFQGDSSLPANLREMETPMQFFCYFFTREIAQMIAEETNWHAVQENVNTTFRTDAIEIYKFIGIMLYMSLYRRPNLEGYWSVHAFAPISSTMPVKRFMAIKKHLCFEDEEQRKQKGQPGYDAIFRIRRLSNALNERFDSVPKTARLCVDEQMCSTKMKHHLRQYMPNKPDKWGIKFFVLCDSSGYAYRFEIYHGAGDNVILNGQPDLGATANVDGLMGRYHIRAKTRNAMTRLFYHFIDMAATNAYIVYRRSEAERRNDSSYEPAVPGKKDKLWELPEFREKIAAGLVSFTDKRPTIGRPSSRPSTPTTPPL